VDYAEIANVASLGTGLISAAFWVVAAIVKAPPPEGLNGKPDGEYWKGTIVNGGELIGTLRAQSKWNSWAAFAAAATMSLQIASNFLR